MRKIIDYKFLRGVGGINQNDVRDAINEGWERCGSPFADTDLVYQALVKYEDERSALPDGNFATVPDLMELVDKVKEIERERLRKTVNEMIERRKERKGRGKMKVDEYEIVYGNNPIALFESVEKKLAEGWELYGNPYALSDKDGHYHFQAMVMRYEEPEEHKIE